MEVDPVRGPVELPKRGKLPHNLLPGLHEVMVLRSRSGQVVALPRGVPPTFSQRRGGSFIEAYYVDCAGAHSRTFSARLQTSDIGVDLLAEIDVEMSVEDCVRAVIDRRGSDYLKDQLEGWAQHNASRLTSGFKVAGGSLASLAEQILARLQTDSQRLSFSGLKIRELRVRLRLADQETVAKEGATTLSEKLKAQRFQDLSDTYAGQFGPELAKIYAALSVNDQTEIPAFLKRLQDERHADTANRFNVLIALLRGEAIEPHMREQLLQDLAMALKLPGIAAPSQELAKALYQAGASAEIADAKPAASD